MVRNLVSPIEISLKWAFKAYYYCIDIPGEQLIMHTCEDEVSGAQTSSVRRHLPPPTLLPSPSFPLPPGSAVVVVAAAAAVAAAADWKRLLPVLESRGGYNGNSMETGPLLAASGFGRSPAVSQLLSSRRKGEEEEGFRPHLHHQKDPLQRRSLEQARDDHYTRAN